MIPWFFINIIIIIFIITIIIIIINIIIIIIILLLLLLLLLVLSLQRKPSLRSPSHDGQSFLSTVLMYLQQCLQDNTRLSLRLQ